MKKQLATEDKWRKLQRGVFAWEGWVMLLCLSILGFAPSGGVFFLLKGGAVIGIILVVMYSIREEIKSRK